MKNYIPFILLSMIVFSGTFSHLKSQNLEGEERSAYINGQKDFYDKVIKIMNSTAYFDSERNTDFDECPYKLFNDDFLGFKFNELHSEQAGFLECDGPTFLRIFDNGLFINHVGDSEDRCYLDSFNLKYSGLKSGTSEQEVFETYGIPMIQTENMMVYGCTLDVDPFGEEEAVVDKTDPDSYILDFFFIFENNQLIAVIYHQDHYCY